MSSRTLPLSARLSAALLPLALAFAGAAGADKLLVLEAHQDAAEIAGQKQEARDGTVEVWIGDGVISRDDEQGKVVLRADELLIVNHEEQTYSVLDLPIDLAKLLPPGMGEVPEAWRLAAEVTAGEERREIGEWKTRRYTVEVTNPMGMAVRTELWTTTDLDIDFGLYHRLVRQLQSMQPGANELAAEMAKVEGFPVLQETTVDIQGGTVKTREELVSIEEKAPPADAYGPPEGYRRTELPAGPPSG